VKPPPLPDPNDVRTRVDFGILNRGAEGDVLGLRKGALDKLGIGGLVEEIKPQLDAAAEEFAKFSDNVRGAFDEIGRHVYSGFYTVLTNLTNKSQTFASAMKTIWQSIVSGIMSAMAQLVSSAITAAFLKLLGLALTAVTGNAAFAMAGSWASGRMLGSGSNVVTVPGGTGVPTGPEMSSTAPGGSLGASPMSARGGDTYYIQTFSAKDLFTSLVSPRGELRTANSRLIEIAAAS